jgi:exodeoxyribonuclease VII small subunit
VGRIESGQLPLERCWPATSVGLLLKFCRERLEAVEGQVKVLDDGVLKPWGQA